MRTVSFCRLILCVLFINLTTIAFSQSSRIDSLKSNIAKAANEKEHLTALLVFCNEWDSYSPDTLHKYAEQAKALASSQKNTRALLAANYFLAAYEYQQNKLDSALKKSEQALADYEKNFSYDSMYVRMYRLIGNIYLRKEQYDSVQAKDYALMKLADQYKDTMGLAAATIGLGNIRNKLQKKEEALQWYYKALGLMENDLYKQKLSFIYNNMAIVYYKLQKEDSMFYFIKLGLKYSKESGNLTDYANALFLYGGMLAEFNKPAEAESAFKQALQERKKIGDIYYLITDMAQFALFYINTKQSQKAIELCLEGIRLAEKNHHPVGQDLYESLQRSYQAAGDYKNATATLEKLGALKDSVYEKNSAEVLAEMQTRYDVQAKEKTIIQQQYDLTRKNFFIYSIAGILAGTLLFGFFFFQNRKKNQQLRLQAMEMEQKKKTAQAVMQAEEDERKRIALDLHDSVAQKMVVAKLNLEAFGSEFNSMSFRQQKIFNSISSLLEESTTEVRHLSHSMMPQAFAHSGITLSVKEFLDKIEKPGLKINFNAEGNFSIIKENTALMIYRIIQECVQNILKHANATLLDISMITSNNEIDVMVEDNGVGFDTVNIDMNETSGLKNIRSRVEYLGGRLDISTNPGMGTVMAFYIPLK